MHKNTHLSHFRPLGLGSDELLDAKTELTAILGKDDYYAWACTLPVQVLMNDSAYIGAIHEKIHHCRNSSSQKMAE